MSIYRREDLENRIVGKKVISVRMDADNLAFLFDDHTYQSFYVWGDCCSTSYFYDFIGVEKLISNGPIKAAYPVDVPYDGEDDGYEYIQCYGWAFVTEHPFFGDQTSVMSFRNSSNGYYGGAMDFADGLPKLPDVKTTILGVE